MQPINELTTKTTTTNGNCVHDSCYFKEHKKQETTNLGQEAERCSVMSGKRAPLWHLAHAALQPSGPCSLSGDKIQNEKDSKHLELTHLKKQHSYAYP